MDVTETGLVVSGVGLRFSDDVSRGTGTAVGFKVVWGISPFLIFGYFVWSCGLNEMKVVIFCHAILSKAMSIPRVLGI